MQHYVRDKVIIVTGGSSGFGLEAARILLEMGAKVVISGRDAQRLARAAEDLGSPDLLPVQADAVNTADWKKLLQATVDRFGHVDVLINNHGAGVKIAPVETLEDSEIETILNINLTSVIKGCRETIHFMKPRGCGQIVNVSSGCAHYSWPQWATYTAAKAGLVGYHPLPAPGDGRVGRQGHLLRARRRAAPASAMQPDSIQAGKKVIPPRTSSHAPWSTVWISRTTASLTRRLSGARNR